MASNICTIRGNQDIYGLGVRVGLYLQTYSVCIAQAVPLKSADHISTSLYVYVLSVYTILFHTTRTRSIEAVEVPIAVFLLLLPGFILTCLTRFLYRHPLVGGLISIQLLSIFPFFLWFYFKGIEVLPSSCPDRYVFFFTKVKMDGWYRTFSKVLFMVGTIAVGFLLFISLIILACFRFGKGEVKVEKSWNSKEELHSALRNAQRLGVLIFTLITPLYILFVELPIRWNHIQDVSSISPPGQLIPFVLGICQMVDTLIRVFRRNKGQKSEDSEENEQDSISTSCPHAD